MSEVTGPGGYTYDFDQDSGDLAIISTPSGKTGRTVIPTSSPAYGVIVDALGELPASYGAADPAHRDVKGQGGYTYRQFADGSVQVVAGKGNVGKTFTSGSAWQAITAEIGPYPTAAAASTQVATGSSSATEKAGFLKNLLSKVTGKNASAVASGVSTAIATRKGTAEVPYVEEVVVEETNYAAWGLGAVAVLGVGAAIWYFGFRKTDTAVSNDGEEEE